METACRSTENENAPPDPAERLLDTKRLIVSVGLFAGVRLVAGIRFLAGVFAFAGIADPQKFFDTLRDAHIDVQIQDPYPDHYHYRGADILAMMMRAEREGLALVTTEKDLARLYSEPDAAALLNVLRVLPVTLAVDELPEFTALIMSVVGRR